MPPDARPRVLVVEDEWLIAAHLCQILEDCQMEVIGPACDVGSALELLAEERPDAALVDVWLGGGRSLPIAARLEELAVPFMFLTGYQEADLGGRHGARRLLAKPFGDEDIKTAVAEMLGLAEARIA